jgi:hypothetical protein
MGNVMHRFITNLIQKKKSLLICIILSLLLIFFNRFTFSEQFQKSNLIGEWSIDFKSHNQMNHVFMEFNNYKMKYRLSGNNHILLGKWELKNIDDEQYIQTKYKLLHAKQYNVMLLKIINISNGNLILSFNIDNDSSSDDKVISPANTHEFIKIKKTHNSILSNSKIFTPNLNSKEEFPEIPQKINKDWILEKTDINQDTSKCLPIFQKSIPIFKYFYKGKQIKYYSSSLKTKVLQKEINIYEQHGYTSETDYRENNIAITYITMTGSSYIHSVSVTKNEEFYKSIKTNTNLGSQYLKIDGGIINRLILKNNYKLYDYIEYPDSYHLSFYYKNGELALENYSNFARVRAWNEEGYLLCDTLHKGEVFTKKIYYPSGNLHKEIQYIKPSIFNGRARKYNENGKLIKDVIYDLNEIFKVIIDETV